MKLHIITVGAPKLDYAKSGWDDYRQRLDRYHRLRISHIADKKSDAAHLLATAGSSYKVVLAVAGQPLSSEQLSDFLQQRARQGREVSFMIGGPAGLPPAVNRQADFCWSLSRLTFPHDLAMVILLEALYRASTIAAGRPYHK